MPLKAAKKDKGYCDRLASKIVRTRTPYCQKCGRTDSLTCSHIIKRTYNWTRTDLDNLQTLCFSCHRKLEDWPRLMSRWISESIGSEKYEELEFKARDGVGKKFDWTAEKARLKAIAKSMDLI